MVRRSKALFGAGAAAAVLALSPLLVSTGFPQPSPEADGRIITGGFATSWGTNGRFLNDGFTQPGSNMAPNYGETPDHLKDAVEADGPKDVYVDSYTGDTLKVVFP